jgi:hypothetical protein
MRARSIPVCAAVLASVWLLAADGAASAGGGGAGNARQLGFDL